jgi:hypothetical protein
MAGDDLPAALPFKIDPPAPFDNPCPRDMHPEPSCGAERGTDEAPYLDWLPSPAAPPAASTVDQAKKMGWKTPPTQL